MVRISRGLPLFPGPQVRGTGGTHCLHSLVPKAGMSPGQSKALNGVSGVMRLAVSVPVNEV